MDILIIIVMLSLSGCAVSLFFLCKIDFEKRLLPNTYVLAFALFGIAFHAATAFEFKSLQDIGGGLVMGGGLLYCVRFFANRIYNQDTLGLGDMKLMMAAGLWLGVQGVLNALVIGACAGIVHGLFIYFKDKPGSLSQLSLPAGPGFIVGIVVSLIMMLSP